MTAMTAPEVSAPAASAGPLRDAIRERALGGVRDPELDPAIRELVAAAPGEVAGVVFYGSRRTQAARADVHSAYDLFLILRTYRGAYGALAAAGKIGRPPWLLSLLNTVLPPNQVSLRFGSPPLHFKCSALSLRAFLRETSPTRQDHFCIGRLFQPCRVLYAADDAAAPLVGALTCAFEETYRWSRPWLPERFDAEAYGRRLLEVSLAREIRPEPAGRAEALWKAQRDEQLPVLRLLLEDLERRGELREIEPATFALVRPVTWMERAGLRIYFTRSLVRATLRWLKHMATFEGWLDYILLKARRHTGEEIVLTQNERRYPLVLLWPRLFRYLRRKDAKRP
jgi:hypothetical protein